MNPWQLRLPRLPVADWQAFVGDRGKHVPGISDLAESQFTTSGQAAIALALELLGVGSGDRVLVPTYHCPTMISPVKAIGAEPVFFPIGEDGAPLTEWIERQDLKRVRALLAAHYFGVSTQLASTRALCDRQDVALIEDCAHAFFGTVGSQQIGTVGDVAIASLTKFFPVTEGGCLASARRSLRGVQLRRRDRVAAVRQLLDTIEIGVSYGRFQPLTSVLKGVITAKNLVRRSRRAEVATTTMQDNREEISRPPFDPDLARQEPALVVRWIERRASRVGIVETRRRNYCRLAERLQSLTAARALHPVLPLGAVPYVFPLWVDEPERCYGRLRRAGVPIFRWDVLWPGTPAIPRDFGLLWSHHVFQLGCHQDLHESDIDDLANVVRMVVEERS